MRRPLGSARLALPSTRQLRLERQSAYGKGGVPFVAGSVAVAARSNPPSTELAGWEAFLGRPTGGLIAFIEATSWVGLVSTANTQAAIQGAAGRLIKWAMGIPKGETLENAAAGAGDVSYAAIAAALVAAQPEGPIDIRIGWEQNLFPAIKYYTWSAYTGDAGTAGTVVTDYVPWFRRLVGILRSASPRFRIHWTPNSYFPAADPELTYPGNAYVDVIGMDAYLIRAKDIDDVSNVATTPEGKMLGAVSYKFTGGSRSLDWVKTFATANGKLVSFDETGINIDNGEYWISRIAAWARDPLVVELGYWDQNNTGDNAADAQNKLSAGQYPASGAQFLREFGPYTIDTPTAHNASNTQTTVIPLVASRPVKEWRLISAPAGYSLSGEGLVVQPGAVAGAVTVQAIDWFAPSITKTLTITKVASLSAWTMAALGSALEVWFDVSDASTITQAAGVCQQINDKSGKARHASQGTLATRPAYSLTGRNALPALTVDGTQRMTLTSTTTLPTAELAHTMICAGYAAAGAATGSKAIWGHADASANSFTRLGTVSGTLRASRAGQNNTQVAMADRDFIVVAQSPLDEAGGMAPSFVRLDGSEQPTQAVTVGPAGASSQAALFARPSAADLWIGSMSEFAFLSRQLTPFEAVLVEGLLASKWAGQSRLPATHAFKTSAPLLTT